MEKKTFTEYLAEETRKAYTYNGAKTYSSTGNYNIFVRENPWFQPWDESTFH